MKKFLFLTGVLMVSLLASSAHAQPELRLVSSGGELHTNSRAKADHGTLSWTGADVDPKDINTLWEMTDIHVVSNSCMSPTEDSAPGASADSDSNMFSSISYITSSFTTNPSMSLTSEQSQYCWVDVITNNTLKYALGETYGGGRYGFTVTPNNTSTWQTQNVACRFQLSGYGVVTEPYTTVSNYRIRSQYIKVRWGTSYVYATFDGDEEIWSYTVYYKNSQGNWVSDTDTTEGIFLDLDITSYQEMTSSSFTEAEIQVSTTPTTLANSLSTSGNNYVRQSVNNYVGTGSGAGSLSAYSTANVTLTLQAKLKD